MNTCTGELERSAAWLTGRDNPQLGLAARLLPPIASLPSGLLARAVTRLSMLVCRALGLSGRGVADQDLAFLVPSRILLGGEAETPRSEIESGSGSSLYNDSVGAGVPEPRGAVGAGGQDGQAVGAERDAIDPAFMPEGPVQGLACRGVPEPCRVVPARRQQPLAIRD